MAKTQTTVVISPPNFGYAEFTLRGTAPLVQSRFSAKAKQMMRDKMLAGSQAKKGKARDPRDFDADYHGAFYITKKGEHGVHAGAFRNALISACRLKNFKMTIAKLSLFIEADGFDAAEGIPLVFITGDPEPWEAMTRNATGVADIRVRPMWREWTIKLRVRWDADQFSVSDVTNLLATVGAQVGIGEGRPDSKSSAGLGFGLFEVTHA